MADIQGSAPPVAYLTKPRYNPALQKQVPHASQLQKTGMMEPNIGQGQLQVREACARQIG